MNIARSINIGAGRDDIKSFVFFAWPQHNFLHYPKIPLAIYEKEPTSLIAYALSSREYAQELKKVIERRQAVVTVVAEHKGPPSPKA